MSGKALIFAGLVMISTSSLSATTYYVDALVGDDTNIGTLPESAWQTLSKLNNTKFIPGDSILFKSDNKWTGWFAPQGAGNEGAPIVVDMYGNGNKPILDGSGQTNHVVRLANVDYWELNNLEITNDSESEGSRIGVYIVASGGQHRHFHLKNLHIHHIMGRYSFEMIGKNTGGIGIIGSNDTRFDDILIENCQIGDLRRVGIFTNGNKGKAGNRPITNLVIRNNTIYRCAGDGAIIRYANKPLIEDNEVYETHNGPQDKVQWGVALWCRSTDGAIVQYNHVYNTYGDMDGQAFDADLEAWGTVVQYNYSHDNQGGFMLVYGSSSDAIVRYNISQNDGELGGHIFDFPVWTNPRGSGIFHNNTIYIDEGNKVVIADEAMSTARFYNNIFYNAGEGSLLTLDGTNRPTLSHNCYYGYSEENIQLDGHAVNADPQLTAPGSGGHGLDSVDGYKLTDTSPCLKAGINKEVMEGNYWLPDLGAHDYFGVPVNPQSIDIGAHQYSAEVGIDDAMRDNLFPSTFDLGHNYPNPFNSVTIIPVHVYQTTFLDASIFSLSGQKLKRLFVGFKPPGNHNYQWNGEDENGCQVSSGTYFCRVRSLNDEEALAKIVFVK